MREIDRPAARDAVAGNSFLLTEIQPREIQNDALCDGQPEKLCDRAARNGKNARRRARERAGNGSRGRVALAVAVMDSRGGIETRRRILRRRFLRFPDDGGKD